MSVKEVQMEKTTLEDVQGLSDKRMVAINKVGIKDIKHPIRIREKNGIDQHTVANFSMYVFLPHHFKGTHMSRFVEILNQHEKEITVESFRQMLPELTGKLDSETAYIEMSFPYFVEKQAPVTKVKSLMDYQVTFCGKLEKGVTQITVKTTVPVTSLCPCSKIISEYGAHNQRSHVIISANIKEGEKILWIEDIIDVAENNGSCELYGLLKRPDEKFVTEKAYDNPKFVEDIVRDVAMDLDQDKRIESYIVEAENFESIHNHSAYARVEKNS